MEIGVYLTLHVGCAVVTFIGWDVTSDYSHFWDSRQKTGQSVSPDAFVPLSAGGAYGASARDLLDEFALVREESRRERGATFICPGVAPPHPSLIALRVMHQWLLARGMSAAVASPGAGSTIDPSIPRVNLFDDVPLDATFVAASSSIADVPTPPPPANFSVAPLFCHPASPSPPCVTITHPQDGFAFTQWQKKGPLEWR
jgi:hypothetical protein